MAIFRGAGRSSLLASNESRCRDLMEGLGNRATRLILLVRSVKIYKRVRKFFWATD